MTHDEVTPEQAGLMQKPSTPQPPYPSANMQRAAALRAWTPTTPPRFQSGRAAAAASTSTDPVTISL